MTALLEPPITRGAIPMPLLREVYRDSNGEVYAPKLVFPFGVKVSCLAFPDLEIDWS